MSLRAIEGRFTQMIAYFLVMNSKRCVWKLCVSEEASCVKISNVPQKFGFQEKFQTYGLVDL